MKIKESAIVQSVDPNAVKCAVPAEEVARVKGLGCLWDKRTPNCFNMRVMTVNGKLTSEKLVAIAEAAKRFGSCSGKNSLCFSCFLMNFPEEAIELVVVHELCHIKVRNHGPAFYALLEHYLPDHRERKKLLR